MLFPILAFIYFFLLIPAKKGCIEERSWGFSLFLSIARSRQWLRIREGLKRLLTLVSLLCIERLHCKMQFFSENLLDRLGRIFSSSYHHIGIFFELLLNFAGNIKALWGYICQCNSFDPEDGIDLTIEYFLQMNIE